MATTAKKITLSPSRDIPFNKLVLSQETPWHQNPKRTMV
jgi:hypothetical protein